ncbi:MAG: GNAT family N-acetyltransferase [Candidatus Brocadiae bacterium]|nr:GNAT family N-acetyltransferase [Candidatus Brocadiia bacterium]
MKTPTAKKPPVLKGTLVTLRPLDPAKDAPGWFEDTIDPDLWKWTDDTQPKTAAETRAQLESWVKNPDLTVWAVIDTASKRMVGTVRVEPRHDDDRVIIADQVNQISRSVWRKGHHKEACQLVFDWAFKDMGAEEIRTKAWAPNDNSWRSMEALGFVKVREGGYMNPGVGVPMPMRHYVLTRKQWMGQKKGSLKR